MPDETDPRLAAEALIAQEHTFTVGNALYLVYRGGAQWRDMDQRLGRLTVCVLVTEEAVFIGRHLSETAESFDAAADALAAREDAIAQLMQSGNG